MIRIDNLREDRKIHPLTFNDLKVGDWIEVTTTYQQRIIMLFGEIESLDGIINKTITIQLSSFQLLSKGNTTPELYLFNQQLVLTKNGQPRLGDDKFRESFIIESIKKYYEMFKLNESEIKDIKNLNMLKTLEEDEKP